MDLVRRFVEKLSLPPNRVSPELLPTHAQPQPDASDLSQFAVAGLPLSYQPPRPSLQPAVLQPIDTAPHPAPNGMSTRLVSEPQLLLVDDDTDNGANDTGFDTIPLNAVPIVAPLPPTQPVATIVRTICDRCEQLRLHPPPPPPPPPDTRDATTQTSWLEFAQLFDILQRSSYINTNTPPYLAFTFAAERSPDLDICNAWFDAFGDKVFDRSRDPLTNHWVFQTDAVRMMDQAKQSCKSDEEMVAAFLHTIYARLQREADARLERAATLNQQNTVARRSQPLRISTTQ